MVEELPTTHDEKFNRINQLLEMYENPPQGERQHPPAKSGGDFHSIKSNFEEAKRSFIEVFEDDCGREYCYDVSCGHFYYENGIFNEKGDWVWYEDLSSMSHPDLHSLSACDLDGGSSTGLSTSRLSGVSLSKLRDMLINHPSCGDLLEDVLVVLNAAEFSDDDNDDDGSLPYDLIDREPDTLDLFCT